MTGGCRGQHRETKVVRVYTVQTFNQSSVHFLNLRLILITIGLVIIGGFDCHLCVYF